MTSFSNNKSHYILIKSAIISSLSAEYHVNKCFSQFIDISKPFHILSLGKASLPMLKAVLSILNTTKTVPNYYALTPDILPLDCSCSILQGNHPIPDQLSFDSTKQIVQFLSSGRIENLVVLLSGGTSSLFAQPPLNFTNTIKSRLHQFLINSGLPINDINTVRRHFSSIKGGKLLRNNINKNIHTSVLAISDVPDASHQDIGSGPFSPDTTTFSDALNIVKDLKSIPQEIVEYLEQGKSGKYQENIKPDEVPSNLYSFNVLLDQNTSLTSIYKVLQKFNYNAKVINLESLFNNVLHSRFKYFKKDCWYYSIGEREINLPLKSTGKGGRITHGILSLANMLYKSKRSFEIIGIATDGCDGSSESGGGFINSEVLTPIIYNQMLEAISNFNSAKFMDTYHLLFPSFPAQTNVGDVFLLRLR